MVAFDYDPLAHGYIMQYVCCGLSVNSALGTLPKAAAAKPNNTSRLFMQVPVGASAADIKGVR